MKNNWKSFAPIIKVRIHESKKKELQKQKQKMGENAANDRNSSFHYIYLI